MVFSANREDEPGFVGGRHRARGSAWPSSGEAHGPEARAPATAGRVSSAMPTLLTVGVSWVPGPLSYTRAGSQVLNSAWSSKALGKMAVLGFRGAGQGVRKQLHKLGSQITSSGNANNWCHSHPPTLVVHLLCARHCAWCWLNGAQGEADPPQDSLSRGGERQGPGDSSLAGNCGSAWQGRLPTPGGSHRHWESGEERLLWDAGSAPCRLWASVS